MRNCPMDIHSLLKQGLSAPMTTVIELSTVSVTDRPTKARAYWVSRFPAYLSVSQSCCSTLSSLGRRPQSTASLQVRNVLELPHQCRERPLRRRRIPRKARCSARDSRVTAGPEAT